MQILGYIIGFILILAVIFIPLCLVAFGVPFLLILLFRLLQWNFVLFFGSVYEEKTDTRILEQEFWTVKV